jgi:hypothetical protein
MGFKKPSASEFLFTRPRGLFGVGRFVDFGGTFDSYNSSDTGNVADATAVFADWKAVGDDLRSTSQQLCTDYDGIDAEKAA